MGPLTRRDYLKSILFLVTLGVRWLSPFKAFSATSGRKEESMKLPTPYYKGKVTLEETIRHRRTVRSFSSRSLVMEELSQLLYAAQGITQDRGFKRAAPSGGALYPLDVYTVVGEKGVEDLDAGVYRYISLDHGIELVTRGDRKNELARTSLSQMWMARAPLNFVITAEYSRICSKYGERGIRYAMIEAGHAGENIFLQAEALGLKAGIVGAFEDEEVIRRLEIPETHEPLLIMPVGYQG
jgi:SagB-type dehydrogenase family enzyme